MASELTTNAEQVVTNVATQVGEAANQSTGALMDSFAALYQPFILVAPKAVFALVVLVLGYFVARLIDRLITAFSDRIGLQKAAERGGVVQSMKDVGIERTVPQILGVLKKDGYEGTLSIEFEGLEDPLMAVSMGLANLRRYLAMV